MKRTPRKSAASLIGSSARLDVFSCKESAGLICALHKYLFGAVRQINGLTPLDPSISHKHCSAAQAWLSSTHLHTASQLKATTRERNGTNSSKAMNCSRFRKTFSTTRMSRPRLIAP